MKKETVLLYSGGTDSTLTACLAADRFDKVNLLTYKRFGIFSVTNPIVNVRILQDKYGKDRFPHAIIPVDKIFKMVSYERFLSNAARHGFFLLSTCGLCKLAMHVRTIVYCIDNGIHHVCDGANQGMHLFPDQMDSVIRETREMYARFGIEYSNPVFDFEGPQDIDFADRLHFERIPGLGAEKDPDYLEKKEKTTGYKLYKLGIMPSENVKGTPQDRRMQPRCFQFILFNIWLHWYYLADHSYEEYEKDTLRFFKEKIGTFAGLLDEYARLGRKSRFSRNIEY